LNLVNRQLPSLNKTANRQNKKGRQTLRDK